MASIVIGNYESAIARMQHVRVVTYIPIPSMLFKSIRLGGCEKLGPLILEQDLIEVSWRAVAATGSVRTTNMSKVLTINMAEVLPNRHQPCILAPFSMPSLHGHETA